MWELPHVLAPESDAPAPAKRRGRKAAAAAGAAAQEVAAALEWPLAPADAASGADASGTGRATAAGVAPPERHAAMADILSRALSAEDGLLIRPVSWWGETDHVFSHIVWDMQVFRAEFGFWHRAGVHGADQTGLTAAEASTSYGEVSAPANYAWIGPEEMKTLAFPNVFVRILQDYWRGQD